MTLHNVEVHQNCFCYDSKSSVVQLSKFRQNDTDSVALYQQEILFVIKGRISVSTALQRDLMLEKGDFIFLPAGTTMEYHAPEDCMTLSMRIQEEVPECHIFQVSKIAERIENQFEGIYILKVNERMQTFLSGVLETYTDGLRCRHYLHMEASRMLFLLHAYYSQEDCLKFFSQVVSPDVKFSEFVRANWMKCGTVKMLADGIYMTPQQFSSRFRKIFGTTPYEWMKRQKAQKIYQDICRSDLSLKEIAARYDFSSQANFFHFCKSAFGNTPGQIRKGLKYTCELQTPQIFKNQCNIHSNQNYLQNINPDNFSPLQRQKLVYFAQERGRKRQLNNI